MRSVFSTLVLATAASVLAMAQTPPAAPRPLIVAELSEMLTHSPFVACAPTSAPREPTRTRIANWNIKGARSAPVDVLAAEIRTMQVDVVALQEVDVHTKRGDYVDQPTALAEALGFHNVFAASIHWDEGHYGLALVSRWPIVSAARHRLGGAEIGEPRIVLDVTVCVGGRPLRILNHHADRRPAARERGFADLQPIAAGATGRGVLLVGDMNEWAVGPGVRALTDAGLTDLGAKDDLDTSNAGRIDFMLADGPVSRHASPVRVWTTDKSDHHAVYTDLEW